MGRAASNNRANNISNKINSDDCEDNDDKNGDRSSKALNSSNQATSLKSQMIFEASARVV